MAVGNEAGHKADVGEHAEDLDEGLGYDDGRGECQAVGQGERQGQHDEELGPLVRAAVCLLQ